MNKSKSTDVAVIGLGNMGSALADTLLSAGYPVVVWNRTMSKSESLVGKGAVAADSVAAAVQAADIVIICVAEHAVCVDLLETDAVAIALRRKLLLQLGVVTSEQARHTAKWAQEHDIDYLEGSILGVPEHVRTTTATLVCSGPKDMFDSHAGLLSVFGNPQHVSETIGAAYDFDKVYYSFAYATILGFVQGAALAHAKGFSIEAYTNIVMERIPNVIPSLTAVGVRISNRDHAGDQATLGAWAAAYAKSLELCQELEVDDTLPGAIMENLNKAIDAGFGDKEMSALFEVLLPKNAP